MATLTAVSTHRDRSALLVILGSLMLLAGLGATLLGPVELAVYYAFAEGGKYYYDGFGFGSFMFAYIAVQVVGYYGIAVIGVVLGYAHVRRRRWASSLAQTLLWVWLVAGLPLTVIACLMLFVSKELALPAIIATLVLLPLVYPVAPLLLMRFYRSEGVRRTLEAADPRPDPLEAIPLPVRGLTGLLILTVLVLHFPLLVRGVFPLFGRLLAGMLGILALDVLILALVVVAWGLARQKRWAWWSALATFGFLVASGFVTFTRRPLRDALAAMQFPPYEMELFQNVPVLDGYYGLLTVLPFVVMLVILLAVGRHMERGF